MRVYDLFLLGQQTVQVFIEYHGCIPFLLDFNTYRLIESKPPFGLLSLLRVLLYDTLSVLLNLLELTHRVFLFAFTYWLTFLQ